MRRCLALAGKAAAIGEVPVGAVLVNESGVAAGNYNRREALFTPLGHAELMAIHTAARRRQNWRLEDLTLYVTLEPCLMCAGAILQARIPRLVFGTRDPKAGAVKSLFNVLEDPRLNHRVEIIEGVLPRESEKILKEFFSDLRRRKKSERLNRGGDV